MIFILNYLGDQSTEKREKTIGLSIVLFIVIQSLIFEKKLILASKQRIFIPSGKVED